MLPPLWGNTAGRTTPGSTDRWWLHDPGRGTSTWLCSRWDLSSGRAKWSWTSLQEKWRILKAYWTDKAMLQYFVGLSAFSSKHLVKILTSKTHEEAEKYGIEETEADCQNVLVDHCWYCEHKQHGRWFTALLRHLEWTQQMEEKCNKWSVNAAVTFIIVLFIFCK